MSTQSNSAGSTAGAFVSTLALGSVSAALYLLLYLHEEKLETIANLIRQGHKSYVVVPIGIALIFSFIHGAFTGRFWDLLGLKARK
ncbi:MAG: hypothetical protein HQL84_15085 [Magnetococcales bacterium]|nr:hypothetical protein [Magnetococcales bacterium]MBF0151344.1 hypothetical protein [Magnetococcales bacterium]MBF0172977.1 hypothetical protein [Magnetococcales bacterium]MBF0348285.1 hypothetical protein [Magnetococcales bacterium]MBF0631942.1 hypothetical protein [Magnetococcales bacterium]